MSRNKELLKNTIIIMFGKISTQLIAFLLLPIYTKYLLKEEYGSVDLVITYISLLAPFVSLQLEYAAFRFLVDCRNEKEGIKKIITNVFVILLSLIFLMTILYFCFSSLINFKYKMFFIAILVFTMISNMLLQITRGLGKNVLYAINSFITGTSNAIISSILIIYFDFGIEGILYGLLISNIICSVVLTLCLKIYNLFNIKYINKNKILELLKYSVPMVPNGIGWWIISVSDRSIISYCINLSANGIYSIASKFSSMIVTLYNMFNLSWSETVALHINDADSSEYLSKTFKITLNIFLAFCIMIIAFMPLIFNVLIDESFYEAYKYIPFLILGSFFNIVMGMLGSLYVGLKRTQDMAKSTIFSAIINILLNVLLIKYLGLWSAVISTVISYLIVSIYRIVDIKKYLNLNVTFKDFLIILMPFLLIIALYYFNNIYVNIINMLLSLVLAIFLNKSLVLKILYKLKKK